MKLTITEMVIELTRKCNMNCCHCLRGEVECLDISDEYLDQFFSNVNHIYTITLSGGEPSLVPDRIKAVIKYAKKHNVTIDNFYMVTNGKVVSKEFINAVLDLYLYCDDHEYSHLALSNDRYHENVSDENLKLLKAFSFFTYKDNEKYPLSDENLISQGRAYENFEVQRDYQMSNLSIEDYGDDEFIIDGMVYLNCEGNILGDCNLSYETQRNTDLIICNIADQNTNLIESFNSYIENFEKLDQYVSAY